MIGIYVWRKLKRLGGVSLVAKFIEVIDAGRSPILDTYVVVT